MPKDFTKEQVFRFSDNIAYAEAGIVSKKILQGEKGNISLFAFDQGEALSEHTTPFDALIQIIEGTAEVRIAGQAHTVDAGESIILPANIPHAVLAIERFKMILTMIRG